VASSSTARHSLAQAHVEPCPTPHAPPAPLPPLSSPPPLPQSLSLARQLENLAQEAADTEAALAQRTMDEAARTELAELQKVLAAALAQVRFFPPGGGVATAVAGLHRQGCDGGSVRAASGHLARGVMGGERGAGGASAGAAVGVPAVVLGAVRVAWHA